MGRAKTAVPSKPGVSSIPEDTRTELDALLALPVSPPPQARASGLLRGRVEDTHHPDLPGRVFVRWTDARRMVQRAWLPYVTGTAPRRADAVLLARPDNDPQWLVTAVLGGPQQPEQPDSDVETLRLSPGQRVRIEAHDGTGLVELDGRDGEVSVRLMGDNVALEAKGRLRLAGDSVQVEGGTGGIDMRTEREVVVRGRTVRIN